MTSNICVELVCCRVNSGYSLKATLEWVLRPDFYRGLTAQSSMSSNYHYVSSVIFKFDEIIIEYFFYKETLASLHFLLSLPFYEAFSIPVKNEKCGEGYTSKFHEQ